MVLDLSEARKATISATSAGCPRRFKGMLSRSGLSSAGLFKRLLLIGVSIAPGATELTVIPNRANWIARLRVFILRQHLLMQSEVKSGKGSSSCTELMLM